MENKQTKRPYSFELASSLMALALILALMYVTQGVLLPLIFSILISISLYPLARLFERIRLGKAFSAILAVIVAIAIISGLSWFIVYESILIGKDASAITDKVLSVLEGGQKWLENQFGIERTEVMEKLREQGEKAMENAGGMISTTFGSIGNILASAILVPLLSFFLLYYRDFFREFFFKAFKSSPQSKVNEVLNKIYEVVQSYLVGLITVMGIVAVLNTVGLMALGIDYAWFFGSLASLLMLLPYIGIAIGSILPALFALATKDSALYALGVVAWFQVVQFLEGNIITPNIVGSKVSINPLMAIIGILLGGMLFGLAGLIIALPFIATLKVIFDANPNMEAFGFLIGEPEKLHLKRNSTQELLMKWGIVRMPKNKKKIEMDINVNVDTPDETPHTEVTYKEINESEELPYEDLPQDEFDKKDDDKKTE
ncbi:MULTISPECIES: AI-2E family transporter [Sphingobacterium]|uniref:AI-2E family transporter n=1 Tax=Sphingobacterium cellulitidis TaxID=1768011 RepID=A0A8H9G1B9_9SPHI|nr:MULTISPECIES: AI-2E family transporter [Sphingobacterium]MBA8987734.1 putative PurR-regulated permease PerM [Sphingobacterium soli]OYD46117.1 AI-2E family transporter [Sphingobacterium cellulitidis]WFB64403.1 AI-2E family transporter [Sphingobacterium sp. WM]GGE22612.1 AI-2E family transporter [Sphingobacterium soli]